jgi:hypothetical protein
MEYNRVTAILLILLSAVSAMGVATNSGSMGTKSTFMAVLATMVTVLGAGMAWTKASPWLVLGLVAAAAMAVWLSTAFDGMGTAAMAPMEVPAMPPMDDEEPSFVTTMVPTTMA